MKIKATLLLLFTLCQFTLADRYALVVGISNYPLESGFHPTTGANDIPYALAALVYFGFNIDNITILKDSLATYKNIVGSIESITSKVKSGDDVFLHFSGHGQRIINYSKNESERYDSSWVPYDAKKSEQDGYIGENHLIDDELNTLLHNIKDKIGEKGKISVVVDACHSEGSTRDLKIRRQTRGISDIFTVPNSKNRVLLKKNRNTIPENWLTLSACSHYEVNQEYKEMKCGLLSFILYVKLREAAFKIPAKDLLCQISDEMSALLRTQFSSLPQTPHLDGPDNLKAQPFVKFLP